MNLSKKVILDLIKPIVTAVKDNLPPDAKDRCIAVTLPYETWQRLLLAYSGTCDNLSKEVADIVSELEKQELKDKITQLERELTAERIKRIDPVATRPWKSPYDLPMWGSPQLLGTAHPGGDNISLATTPAMIQPIRNNCMRTAGVMDDL